MWANNGAYIQEGSAGFDNRQPSNGSDIRRPEYSSARTIRGEDGREYVIDEKRTNDLNTAHRSFENEALQRSAHHGTEYMEVVSMPRDSRYEKIVADDQRQPSYLWRYTSSSNAKSLHSVKDAERYIVALADIWKVSSSSPKGDDFLRDLMQAVHDGKPEYKAEYSLTNPRGETTYVMVVIRAVGSQQREVLYSFQQMTDPSVSAGSGGAHLPERKTIKWFQQKAAESLRIHTSMIRSFNTSLYREDRPPLQDEQNPAASRRSGGKGN